VSVDIKPPYPYDMFADMMACKEIMIAVQDDTFAGRLYASICNRMWFKITPDEVGTFNRLRTSANRYDMEFNEYWSASWRSAGGIIADMREPFLRGTGKQLEDYIDWYCRGSEGYLFDDVAEMLGKLNWYSPGNQNDS
jgi:hypothetical protein